MPSGRWLVGGPPRCGKSKLAEAIHSANGSLAVLRVDALLHVYRDEPPAPSDESAQGFLRAYLNRPRFMDPARTKTQRPIDDFNASEDELVASVAPKAGEVPLAIIARLLDCLCDRTGKQGWIALDLMPELHFQYYKKVIPDLHLVVLLRDPAEMAAAVLYWRTYPKAGAGAGRRLQQALFSWALSLITAESLQKSHLGEVTILSSNALWQGKAELPERLKNVVQATAPGSSFDGPAFFSLTDDGERFFCPDGRLMPLLDHSQWQQVAFYRQRFWDAVTAQPKPNAAGRLSGFDIRVLGLRIGGRVPYVAKRLADISLRPFLAFADAVGMIRGSIGGATGR